MSVVEIGVTGVVFLPLSCVFEQPRLPRSPEVWGAALMALSLVPVQIDFGKGAEHDNV